MFRISNKVSTVISLILAVLLFLMMGFLVYWLPEVVNGMIDIPDNIGNRQSITDAERQLILVGAYAAVGVAYVTLVFLVLLLHTVLRGRVFSSATLRWLNLLSLCCFAEAVLFLLGGFYFQLVLGVAVAACFLGLLLRVVKNVINEAMRIKSENDLTV
ncbi:MAG: DUF2975 domain-containing protein [Clostridia bacterium]|nr:DUF2975 domain-containing protein [Clostridia bacterium]